MHPPVFLHENPGSHLAVAHIVQTFIEHVGLPTVDRWTRAANAIGWRLDRVSSIPTPYAPGPLIPSPRPATAHYRFLGRPQGNLPALSPPIQPVTESTGSPPSFDDIYDNDPIDDHTLNVLDLHDRCNSLSISLREAEDLAAQRLEDQHALEAQIQDLREAMTDVVDRNDILYAKLLGV